MGVVTAPNGTPVALETVTVKNNATGTVHSTSATNAAGRWDADIADETQAYRVEIGGASGGTQRVVQAPASIELEWLFVRYGVKVVGGPVELPTNTTVGGVSISQATLDSRYVNVAGDTMTSDLSLVASASIAHSIAQYTGDINGPRFHFQKGRGNATTRAAVANGDVLGDIYFQGWDGASVLNAALVRVSVDGAPGTNDLPGRITFLTTPDGSTAVTERLSLRADGLVNIPGRLAVAGQVLAGWGSTGAPGYAFTGDENTGLFRNNEGNISMINNGAVRFSTTAVGADLIGALNVSGAGSVGGGFTVNGGLNVASGDANIAAQLTVGSNTTVGGNLTMDGITNRVNGQLVVDGQLLVGGILRTVTGVSLIWKAIEVRDGTGVNVGWIPVYSAANGIS